MPKHSGRRWGLAVAVSLVSALGCNAILDNEEGHLPSDDSGGGGNVSGTTGSGGKGTGGKGSGGATTGGTKAAGGGLGADAGAAGLPGDEAGAAGESSGGSGGSPTPSGGTLGSGGKSGTGGAAKGGSGGTLSSGGSGPATGGNTARGGTNTGGQTTPPGGSSSGGTGPACATTDPSSCPTASSVRYCESGSYRTVACATRCAENGFEGAQAMCSSTICMCGAGLDPECQQGVVNYCSCVAGGCTQAQSTGLYVNCYQGGTVAVATRCWANVANCADGAALCGT